jgi:hypothetical protein
MIKAPKIFHQSVFQYLGEMSMLLPSDRKRKLSGKNRPREPGRGDRLHCVRIVALLPTVGILAGLRWRRDWPREGSFEAESEKETEADLERSDAPFDQVYWFRKTIWCFILKFWSKSQAILFFSSHEQSISYDARAVQKLRSERDAVGWTNVDVGRCCYSFISRRVPLLCPHRFWIAFLKLLKMCGLNGNIRKKIWGDKQANQCGPNAYQSRMKRLKIVWTLSVCECPGLYRKMGQFINLPRFDDISRHSKLVNQSTLRSPL